MKSFHIPMMLCAVALLAGVTGCSTAKVHTEYDGAVNFTGYRTYAVLSLTATGVGTDPGEVLRLTKPAEQAVRESLNARQLKEATREQADCAVSVRGESLPRIEVSNWGYAPYAVGSRRRGWVYHGGFHNVDVRTTMDRKLIVEIYDNASHKLAWVGWIENSSSGPVQPEKLAAGVHQILENFPPPSAPAK
jgi:hypothetical protein